VVRTGQELARPIFESFRTRCPLAFEKCVEGPPLIEAGDGHAAACWLAQTKAPTALAGDIHEGAREG
jgi:hypothetical protein